MQGQDLNVIAESKWAMFFRAATATGGWFVAFVASVGLAKWSDGSAFALMLAIVSFAMSLVTSLLMISAMLEASMAGQASQEEWKRDKAEDAVQ